MKTPNIPILLETAISPISNNISGNSGITNFLIHQTPNTEGVPNKKAVRQLTFLLKFCLTPPISAVTPTINNE